MLLYIVLLPFPNHSVVYLPLIISPKRIVNYTTIIGFATEFLITVKRYYSELD